MVFEKVQTMLADQLNISKDKITMESDIINDLGADSLDVVELLMSLEDVFNITVPDEMANKLQTIGAVVKFVEENKK
ncbi:MAG TPA: acyl carrier protein [Eubacteriales bacterium]|nr:acyl carrier protein [Clostridia bacterium]HPG92037.1 acyl carrier protein [Clostridia bacterium]HRX13890.1 acyl carrier protein [Eubacteriales bacterium]